MSANTDFAHLSLQERLTAMDMLWESLAAEPEVLASPQWHSEILADRLQRVATEQAKFLPLQAVRSQLDLG